MTRPGRLVTIALAVGAAVAASLLLPPTAWQKTVRDKLKREAQAPPPEEISSNPQYQYDLPFEFNGVAKVGDKNAKVEIVSAVPGTRGMTCSAVEDSAYLVWQLMQDNPGKIRGLFIDFQSPGAAQALQEYGVPPGCSGILVNRKQSATVHFPDEDPYEVYFKEAMGATYSDEELVQAVAEEFERQYGQPMKRPDLEAVRKTVAQAKRKRGQPPASSPHLPAGYQPGPTPPSPTAPPAKPAPGD